MKNVRFINTTIMALICSAALCGCAGKTQTDNTQISDNVTNEVEAGEAKETESKLEVDEAKELEATEEQVANTDTVEKDTKNELPDDSKQINKNDSKKAVGELSDDEKIWSFELDTLYDYITSYSEDDISFETEGYTGIDEILMYEGIDGALNGVGYTFVDLDADGTNELLVGEVRTSDFVYPTCFLAGFVMRDNMPYLLFEGWSRNSNYLLDDNTFLNEGSSGAASSMIAIFKLSAGDKKISYLDCFFTEPDPNDMEVINVYRNKTGVWDPEASEYTGLQPELLWDQEADYLERAQTVDLKPFAEYK